MQLLLNASASEVHAVSYEPLHSVPRAHNPEPCIKKLPLASSPWLHRNHLKCQISKQIQS